MTLSKLNHLPKVPPPVSSHLELELKYTNLGETQTSLPQQTQAVVLWKEPVKNAVFLS